jgi:hypothetical protein
VNIRVDLKKIFENHAFSQEQRAFYETAIRASGEAISIQNFEKNVTVDEAMAIKGQDGYFIGPPLGMQDYLRPLHSYLASRHGGDPEALSKPYDGQTTRKAIDDGLLGVYTTKPMLSFYGSQPSEEEIYRQYSLLLKQLEDKEITQQQFDKQLEELSRAFMLGKSLGLPTMWVVAPPDPSATMDRGMSF